MKLIGHSLYGGRSMFTKSINKLNEMSAIDRQQLIPVQL